MDRLGPCMVAPVRIQLMNVYEWVNVTHGVKCILSGQTTRKALYKYSPFTILFALIHSQTNRLVKMCNTLLDPCI